MLSSAGVADRPLIVGVGRVGMEIVGVVSRLPDHDNPVELDEITVQVGGPMAVSVGTATALGCRTRLCCKLAEDFLGAFIAKALRDAGIEGQIVRAPESRLSSLQFTAIPRDHSRRVSFYTHGDVSQLEGSEVDVDAVLQGASALLVDGHCPSAQVALAEAAHARDVPVIFDGSQIQEGVGTLVALADVLICSERLAGDLAPRDEIEESLLEIQRLGPDAVIITLGDAGSVGLHGDQLVKQPSFEVEVADTTGAGSVYHGAFTAALLSKLPFAQCMEFASAAAALSCRRAGAWAGIPERDEVVATVRSRHRQ
jgi:sugar/nucleoside kinase (ribokinase family)